MIEFDDNYESILDQVNSKSRATLFREAVLETIETFGTKDLALFNSFYALASEDSELKEVLNELLGLDSYEMAIHFDGENIKNHSMRAKVMADLVKKYSATLAELSKSISGSRRIVDNFFVTAPMPGSIQLKFKNNRERRTTNNHLSFEVEDSDEMAMRTFTSLLILANDSSSDAFFSGVRDISGKSRQKLGAFVDTLNKEEIEVSGQLITRKEVIPLSIGKSGYERILAAARATKVEKNKIQLEGFMDGWTWSRNSMRFQPIQGRSIEAIVPHKLGPQVARLMADNTIICIAKFEELRTFKENDFEFSHLSYTLLDIHVAPSQETLSD